MSLVEHSSPRQEVRAFWTGPGLSLYEQLSLKSFVASGARVLLYSYDKGVAIPDGVELVDANEILPGQIYHFQDASGGKSLALHSDLFRYVTLEKYGGWYVDADIVFLGKQLPASDIYIARETEKVINGAVMKFPPGAPLMTEAIKEARRLLPQTELAATHEARLMIGPPLMTRLMHEFSLTHLVEPRSRAYEIGYDEIPAFFDPASCDRLLERVATSDFTHLWNEVWRWVRIPKNLGPPEGSFLDALFRRVDMTFSPQARLSYNAITDWFREHRLLQDIKYRIQTERLPQDAMDQLTKWFRSAYIPPSEAVVSKKFAQKETQLPRTTRPQTMQTFWHGDFMTPYQLLCLRSFHDRGHQVEVFSYQPTLALPGWIERRNAAEVLPQQHVIRRLEEQDRFAIHASLFRYALLYQRGGWWIDPDIVLLRPELPSAPIFFPGPDVFGLTSTGVLRFPKGSALIKDAFDQTVAVGDQIGDWNDSGAPLLTTLVKKHGLEADFINRTSLGPLSWFGVPMLFDPSRAMELEQHCASSDFLQLHSDAWLRAGIPNKYGPPRGSFLDILFERHGIETWFPDRMEFSDLNRWIQHMYQSVTGGERSRR